jgi:hypothetical protein
METVRPGQTTIITQDGIPSGSAVGFQVLKAANGLVAIVRTTAGVVNTPPGTGNYTINFNAPLESDLYLVVIDWTAGVLDELAIVRELRVASSTAAPTDNSGLGVIANYAKGNMGGVTWKRLEESSSYGPAFIAQAIDVVKSRIFTTPPSTAQEATLPLVVLDYLGICVALQLIPAARDLWMQAEISKSVGEDATEIVTYANRAAMMDALRDDLLRRLPDAQKAALPNIEQPALLIGDGPLIDEDSDVKVTADPRDFNCGRTMGRGLYPDDAWGYGLPQRTGVKLP